MTRKSLLVVVLLLLLRLGAHAQVATLDAYCNQLFFHVFAEKPDPAIQDFLKTYLPSLLDKNNAPAGNTNGSKFSLETHGFVFLKHPFIKTPFASGKIEFDCRRFNDARGVVSDNTRMWFYFDTQQEAETTFGQIVTTLTPLASQNRVYTDSGSMIGDFTDPKATSGFYRARFFLTTDFLDKKKFILLCEVNSK